jgi:hypothetical protein
LNIGKQLDRVATDRWTAALATWQNAKVALRTDSERGVAITVMSANLERLRHRLGGSKNIGEIKRIREQASHLAGGAGIEIEELCEAKLAKLVPRRIGRPPNSLDSTCPQAKMIISKWHLDPADGLPTRTVRADDSVVVSR